jgi:outer membrane protein assembly factor BamB
MRRLSFAAFLTSGCTLLPSLLAIASEPKPTATVEASLALNESWLQFRGPNGQGISTSTSVPTQFGLTKGMQWQTPIEGKGWSSPVVANGRVWLTTAITTDATPEEREAGLAGTSLPEMKDVAGSVELRAICIDFETGNLLHEIKLASFDAPEPIHPLNSYASPTPIIEGDYVYCHFGSYGTWCLRQSDGETVWTKRLVIDHSVGPGGSPLIVDNLFTVACDGIDLQFVVALDKSTGEEVWRTPRPKMRAVNGEFQKAYSTPILISVNRKKQLVVPGAQWIVAYDPQTGSEIWRADHGNGFSLSSAPIYTGTDQEIGLVVFTTGYGQTEVVAIRPDGIDDVTLSHIAWRSDRNVPAKPSPVHAKGLIYTIDDNGVLSCFRSADASPVFRKRVPGNFSASPLLAAGHIYLSNQEGIVTVIKQSDQYEEVAKIQLDSRLMASPAAVGGALIIRSEQSLMKFATEK